MSTVITVLHVFVCFFLIAVVLLQRGKGAEIGAVFGSRGAGNFLTKLTTASAVIFMLTSLTLSYLRMSASQERLFDDSIIEEEAPAEESLFEEFGTVEPKAAAPTEPAAEPPADTP